MTTTSFYSYLLSHLPDAPLLEISDLFPKDQINELFYREIDKLLQHVSDPRAVEELHQLRRIDMVRYIDAALRRFGFGDPDLDSLVHDLVVKLLITGNLFRGWTNQSLVGRFKIAVANAAKTLGSRRSKQRKRSRELHDDHPVRVSSDDLIDEFRNWLRARYGEVAVRVFDHRLDGGSTADLLGEPGTKTSYKLKKVVASIKDAAREYSARDPELFRMVARAFDDEALTMRRRFPQKV